jgi:hypothetical protein
MGPKPVNVLEFSVMFLPAAVGANLWLVSVLLPVLPQRGWMALAGRGIFGWLFLALLGPAALVLGVRRRSLLALFVGFPFLCLLPELIFASTPDGNIGAPPLPLVAVLLVAYLFAAAHALSRAEIALDPQPLTNQPLPTGPTPPRWLRRMRLYRVMVVAAAIFPAALLFWALGWPATRDSFEASFGAHTDEALAAVTAGIGLLWIGLCRAYFLGPLDGHLHHDREVRLALESARRQAKRGRPRPAFYIAVVCALAAMAAVLWQRAQ